MDIGLRSAFLLFRDVCQAFSDDLSVMHQRTSVNGFKIILGDLNARLQQRFPREASQIGDFVFGDPGNELGRGTNKEIVLEMRVSHFLVVGNTCFAHSPDEQVIFRSAGVPPKGRVAEKRFAVLDNVPVQSHAMDKLQDVMSCRDEPLQSQHYLLKVSIDCEVEAGPCVKKERRLDNRSLTDKLVCKMFSDAFQRHLEETIVSLGSCRGDVNSISRHIARAFDGAANASLPSMPLRANIPWISQATLDFTNLRREARLNGKHTEEALLHNQVRLAARRDRSKWRKDLAGSGSWDALVTPKGHAAKARPSHQLGRQLGG